LYETLKGVLKNSGKLGFWWGLPITRGTLTATFESEWARGGETLGGFSLKEAGRPSVVEWEVAASIALRLLKTGPSAESSSDTTSTTHLPFSRGDGAGDAWTVVRGDGAGDAWKEQRHPRPEAPMDDEQGH